MFLPIQGASGPDLRLGKPCPSNHHHKSECSSGEASGPGGLIGGVPWGKFYGCVAVRFVGTREGRGEGAELAVGRAAQSEDQA